MERKKNNLSLKELVEDAPKTLNKEYLQQLYFAMQEENMEQSVYVEALTNSLVLIIIEDSTPILLRYFAVAVLQKLSPICGLAEIFTSVSTNELVNFFPVLLLQDLSDSGVIDIVKQVSWSFYNEFWAPESSKLALCFVAKVLHSSICPLPAEDFEHMFKFMVNNWLITTPVVPVVKPVSRFKRSPSTISVTEIDGSNAQDFFTVLNYAPLISPEQLRSIQVFSSLRLYLGSTFKSSSTAKPLHSTNGRTISEDVTFAIREYCLRIIDQVDRKVQFTNVAEFQKACLVEVIELFNMLCCVDSGIVHSVFPVVRRVYDHIHSNISADPEVQDVAVLTSAMTFFMNHGSSVMHKPDSLYQYLFCDLLNKCYQDNFVSFEIIHLMKENLAQLCYHSSILEKYFPTFFKVFAWRPTTFLNDFLKLLPAFMSQQTSVEVFHTLLDLPCLTAVLVLTGSNSDEDQRSYRDSRVSELLRKPEMLQMVKFFMRKNSGIGDTFDGVNVFHRFLAPLAINPKVTACAGAVIPLLKCYFSTFLQYADLSVTVLLIPVLLDRLSIIFPVPKYKEQVHSVLSQAIIQLFELHPEAIFHCQKYVVNYISHLKNYFMAEQSFMHLVYTVGEYVSIEYSDACRPEVVIVYFESLECTLYEALAMLSADSSDIFLKFLSVSFTTLSKLAARSQDRIPRAVLCLGKAHQQLVYFGKDYKTPWRAVIERLLELLSLLNSPNSAAIVLSPEKDMKSGKLHRDPTSLPYVLRTITKILS